MFVSSHFFCLQCKIICGHFIKNSYLGRTTLQAVNLLWWHPSIYRLSCRQYTIAWMTNCHKLAQSQNIISRPNPAVQCWCWQSVVNGALMEIKSNILHWHLGRGPKLQPPLWQLSLLKSLQMNLELTVQFRQCKNIIIIFFPCILWEKWMHWPILHQHFQSIGNP